MRWQRALITGASAGLGASFARQLAEDGTHLVLVARRRERLDELAGTLAVPTEVIVADLTERAGIEAVVDRLRQPSTPIDLLVNNAGVGTDGLFIDAPIERELAMVNLNVNTLVELTHAAIAHMRRGGGGTVLNVSSIAGNQPRPELATYGATKAFVSFFSQAVDMELAGTNVNCTALLPGLTRTEFHEAAGLEISMGEWAWMSADEVVAEGLSAAAAGQRVRIAGRLNRLYSLVTTARPGRVRSGLLNRGTGAARSARGS